MLQNSNRALRRLHALFSAISSMHPAKAAIERTTDTCMVPRRTFPKERRPEISLNRNTVKRRPWKAVRPFHRPFRIAAVQTEGILIRQPANGFKSTLSSKRFNQLQQRLLALPTHYIVNILGVEGRFRIDRRK